MIGNQTLTSSTRSSGTGGRRPGPVGVACAISVVMEDPVAAGHSSSGGSGSPAADGASEMRPFLGQDRPDDRPRASSRRSRGDPLRPRRRRRPAAGPPRTRRAAGGPRRPPRRSAGCGRRSGGSRPVPVMTTGVPATIGRSAGFSVQQVVEPPAAARRERAAGRRPALVRRPSLDRDERLAARPRRGAGSSAAARPCTGATGSANRSSVVAVSTMKPGVHDVDPLGHPGDDPEVVGDQDERRAATPRSGPRRSSRTWAWIVTSRAVVGSSAIISCGSSASAIAIITRWRMPPENWCG